MSIKTILACLTTEQAALRTMQAACGIAREFDAHLIGIHTIAAIVPYPGIALHIDHPQLREFNRASEEQNTRIKAIFDEWSSKEPM
ncbi:MAG: hypothetical protein GY789_25725 [Hyphomicrobiales bacterium]|nr:hypothetical protein [Hyphomicrobiales bacterium]MCP4999815.1 hypothetical protein [Hyphomicrobiales bacterium]